LQLRHNQVDEGAWVELAELHRELDEAVAGAYGWPAGVAHDPIEAKARLADLFRQIREGLAYRPFG